MTVKFNFLEFWKKGYFYIVLATIIFLVFILNGNVGLVDWVKEVAYFNYIKASLNTTGDLPFFWWYPSDILQGYPFLASFSVFLGNPETIMFFPAVWLLKILSPLVFIKFYLFLFFIAGVIGCFWLKKTLQWNDLQLRTYLILFLFSPLVIQRLMMGYTVWIDIFLFPWLIFFHLHKKITVRIFGQAAILGLTILNGGIHVAIWFFAVLFFFVLYDIFVKKSVRKLLDFLLIILFVCCLAFTRLFFSFVLLSDLHQIMYHAYNPLVFIFWAIAPFISIFPFNLPFLHRILDGVGSWEGSFFMGAALPLFIMAYVYLFKNRKKIGIVTSHSTYMFMFAGLACAILAMEPVYKTLIGLLSNFISVDSLVSADRYPFRYMIPAYLSMSVGLPQIVSPLYVGILEFFTKLKCRIGPSLLVLFEVFLYCVSAISAGGFILLTIFREKFLSFLQGIVEKSYYNQNDWLSVLVQYKSYDLAYYIDRMRVELLAGVGGLLFLFIFSFLTAEIIRHREKIKNYFIDFPYIFLELILLIPIACVCCMWTTVALSRPYSFYSVLTSNAPKVEIQQGNLQKISYDTQSLKINFVNNTSTPNTVMVYDIKPKDVQFIAISPKDVNITKTDQGTIFSVSSSNQIIITANKSKLFFPKFITLFSWSILGLVFLIYFWYRRKTNKC